MERFSLTGLIVVTLSCLLAVSSWAASSTCPNPPVQQGQLDLACLQADQPLPLSGNWKLTYQASHSDYHFNGITPVPGTWLELTGNPDFRGMGTYRLTFDGVNNHPSLSLSLPNLWAARHVSLVYPDGQIEKLFEAGEIEDQANFWKSPARNPLIPLPRLEDGTVLEISLGVYATSFAGLWRAPVIGATEKLQYSHQLKKMATIATATTLLWFCLVIIALMRIKLDISGSGSLACVAVLLAVYQLNDAGIIYDLLPTLSVGLEAWLSWLNYLLGVGAGFHYMLVRYRQDVPGWAARLPLVMSGIGLILLVTTDLATLQHYGTFHHPMVMTMALLCFISLAYRLDTSRPDRLLTVSGFCAITFALAFDLIDYYYLNDAVAIPMISLAWILFIGGQILLLSQRYVKVFDTNAQLNEELSELNQSLEKRIQARTHELDTKNRQLEVLSRTDALTGLANRRVVQEFVNHEFARLNRQPGPMSVALLDIDYFKRINDQHGHTVGDDVLVSVAALLAESVRESDLVARWGGEEFCMIFPGITLEETYGIIERIRKKLASTPIKTANGHFIEITCSSGLTCTNHPLPFERLMDNADIALYRAKNEGRNQTQLAETA